MASALNTKRQSVLVEWRRQSRRQAEWHLTAARRAENFDRFLTATNILAALFVLVFPIDMSRAEEIHGVANWTGGSAAILLSVVSVSIVFIAIIQYIFDYRGRAHSHLNAAKEFADIYRRVEVVLVESESCTRLEEIEHAWTAANRAAPLLATTGGQRGRFLHEMG